MLVVRAPGASGSRRCARPSEPLPGAGLDRRPGTGGADAAPYAPLVHAVEYVLASARLVEALSPRTRSVLAELTPLIRQGPARGPVTRHQVVGAVRQVLRRPRRSAGRPHRGRRARGGRRHRDGALHLAGTDATGRLLVVWRTAPPGRETLLEGWRGLALRTVRHRRLAPLSRDNAAVLVARPVRPRPRRKRRPEPSIVRPGTPSSCWSWRLRRPPATRDGHGSEPVGRGPPSARGRRRATRAALQRLAVVGEELGLAAVIAVTQLPESDAFAVLDTALAAEVLVVRGTRYGFRQSWYAGPVGASPAAPAARRPP